MDKVDRIESSFASSENVPHFKACLLEKVGTEELISYGVKIITELLGGDFTAYNLISADRKIIGFATYPFMEEKEVLAALVKINKHLHEHPLIRHFNDRNVSMRSMTISDFLSDEEYRKTELYTEVYQSLGFNYQIGIQFVDDSGCQYTLGCSRIEGDFDEADRELLNLLYPHFLKAIKCNQLIGQRLNQLRTAAKLTPRESDALFWLSEGKTNPEMAQILGISSRTVDKTLQYLYRKLGFANRAAAMRYATSLKLSGFSKISK